MNIDDLKGKFDAGHELTWEDQQDMLAEIDRLRAVLTEIRDDPILVDYIDPPMRWVINRALSPNSVLGSTHLTLTPPSPHNHQVACPNDTAPSQKD